MQRITFARICVTFLLSLIFFPTFAQEDFQVKWTMDFTQAGTSSHMNFTPANALLAGGPNTYTLPTVYSAGGAIGMGYVTRPWPKSFSPGRHMEFSFSANSFKYDITGISFRLRRSANGAAKIKLRSSADGFQSDLTSEILPSANVFHSYTVPVNFRNLSSNSFAIRIYAYDPVDIYGTFWFDEIIISGKVLAIILPVTLTSFEGRLQEKSIGLLWKTSFEQNAREFVVERSSDLRMFEDIGTVPAAGDTQGSQHYQFVDHLPITGNNYYRLKLVDHDDRFSYSQVVDIINNDPHQALSVYPNPAYPEKITILGHIPPKAQLRLLTVSGKEIPFKHETASASQSFLYPDKSLNPGMYILSFLLNGSKEHIKILVR